MEIKRSILKSVCAAVFFAVGTSVCLADPLTFTLSGVENGTFTLDSNPTPSGSDIDSDTYFTGIFNTMGALTISFYDANAGGGYSDTSVGSGYYGPQIFSGTEANPIFTTGVYQLSTTGPNGPFDETLTITSTPEPSGSLLLLTGLTGIAFTVTRKRKTLAPGHFA